MSIHAPGHSPDPTSSLRDAEGLGRYFPLNPEQIERAKNLDIPEDEIGKIRERMLQGLEILSTLKCNPIAYETLLYMTQGVKRVDLPEDKGINERAEQVDARKRVDAISEFLDTTFHEGNIASGAIFIAPYYMGPEHKDRFLYMFGLLFMWKKLGVNNKCFARIPTVKEYRPNFGSSPLDRVTPEGMRAWGSFTGYKEGGRHYQYALGYDGNTVKKIHDAREIDTKNIPAVFSSLGDIEPKVGERAPEKDIAYLEEQYVLFGPLDTHPPYKKVMEAFLRNHKDFFLADINARCGWEEGRRFLTRLGEPSEPTEPPASPDRNRGPRPQRPKNRLLPQGSAVPYVAPQSPPSPQAPQEVIREKKFPRPEIYGGFSSILRGGNTYSESAKKTASNFPSDTVLWVGRGENPILWRKYERDELITILPIHSSTTFSFCFTGVDYVSANAPESSEKYPHTSITVVPRLSPTPPPLQSTLSVGVEEKVQAQVAAVVPTFSISPQEEELNRTDEVGLEILDIMERVPEGVIISLENPVSREIHGVFQTDPIIYFVINTETKIVTLGPSNPKGVNISRLQSDLHTSFSSFLERVSQVRDDLYLRRYVGLKHKLSFLLGQLTSDIQGDDSEIPEIDDILRESEINGRYGGDIFMSSLHRGKFEAIRTMMQSFGIDISLVDDSRVRGRNYSVAISIEDGLGGKIQYTISRQDVTPRYTFQVAPDNVPVKVDRAFREIALNLYLNIALLGKQIFLSQPGTPLGTPRKWSDEQIVKMLDGTYTSPKHTAPNLSGSDKALIHQAAERVKRGNLKVSQGQTSESSSGLMVPHIVTARGITEFHRLEDHDEIVLIDTKLSCINDEKARQIEENWGKRKRKHPYSSTYALLRTHERSRKYLIRRMIASIKNEEYRGLSPLSNRMATFFQDFWEALPKTTQGEFFKATTGTNGHAGRGLSVMLPSGRGLFDTFIEMADEKKIPLLYSKPKTLPKESVVEYIQSKDYELWIETLRASEPDISEVRGK